MKREITKVAVTIAVTALGVAGGMLFYDRVLRKVWFEQNKFPSVGAESESLLIQIKQKISCY